MCDDFRERLFGSWKDNCRYHLLKNWLWLGSRSVRDTLVTSEGSRGETKSRIQSRWMLATRLHRAKFGSFLAAFCSILCPLQFSTVEGPSFPRRCSPTCSRLSESENVVNRLMQMIIEKKSLHLSVTAEEKNGIGKTATTTDCTFSCSEKQVQSRWRQLWYAWFCIL